jgi:adenine-specific DNA-methyltransferase
VLDFFSGSGTTAAVAHKLNRQYIACEQIDHQMELNVNRLKQVIEGDDVGISDDVDWQGGGSFIYLELKKYNQVFIDEIETGTKTEEQLSIWEKMKQKAFFRFNVDMQKFDEETDEFKALTLGQQKECLLKMLDLNQLYVNLSDMEDQAAKVTEEEKNTTKNFYQEA